MKNNKNIFRRTGAFLFQDTWVPLVVFANKAETKMSGEVYILWLISLLKTVTLSIIEVNPTAL